MSHEDSLDDETKQLLKDIESQGTHSDDSKESNKDVQEQPKVKDKENKYEATYETDEYGNKWETNTKDTPDSEW